MELRMHRILLFLCLFSTVQLAPSKKAKWSDSTDGFNIKIVTDGSYSISINNITWFNSAPTFFFTDGHKFVSGKDLKLTSTTSDSGLDKIGAWTRTNFNYQAGSSNITAYIKTYNDNKIPCVIFGQLYIDGASKTSAGYTDHTISSFPGFKFDVDMQSLGFLSYGGMMFGDTRKKMGNYINGASKTSTGNTDNTISSFPGFTVFDYIPPNLGYLSYGGIMFGDTSKKIGNWSFSGTNINYGIEGGPLAVFDNSGNAVIISSANNFMSTSNYHESIVDVGGEVHWGTMGLVDEVPAGHVVETVVYYSNKGINKAFEGWGEYLRYIYNRHDQYVKSDLTINYLGYWTDNGAYYYYKTEDGKSYEDTILDAKAYADQLKIPYRYVQYDSWWYYKGLLNGVKEWISRPDIFPNGMQYVYNKTGLLVNAHNRFWSPDTVYAKQNGGRYEFIKGPLRALPIEQKFWDDLFVESKKWGLITYEQDWLNDEFLRLKELQTDIDLGTTWLKQMGSAAQKNGITIQYCMSLTREAMFSLEIPVVTQARVSNDYSPGQEQWRIGISSMFAYAMGVAPFKDNFWTTTNQTGNPYGRSEPFHALNAAVATLSTGPVGPSDKIGCSNATLIMKCCNTDGLILKPSKPATAIDDQILQSALGQGGPMGEVWTTYSKIGALWNLYFGIILAADISNTYDLTPAKAGFVAYTNLIVFSVEHLDGITEFSEEVPLRLSPSCTKVNFCLFYVTPIFNINDHKIVILGEISKWVPVSPQRVTQIYQDSNELTLDITGQPGESVPFYFNIDGQTNTISCVLGASGSARIMVLGSKCLAS